MNIKNEIKGYIAMAGETISSLALKLGTQQPMLSRKINNESIRYKDIKKIADLLGYEIVWKKRE